MFCVGLEAKLKARSASTIALDGSHIQMDALDGSHIQWQQKPLVSSSIHSSHPCLINELQSSPGHVVSYPGTCIFGSALCNIPK